MNKIGGKPLQKLKLRSQRNIEESKNHHSQVNKYPRKEQRFYDMSGDTSEEYIPKTRDDYGSNDPRRVRTEFDQYPSSHEKYSGLKDRSNKKSKIPHRIEGKFLFSHSIIIIFIDRRNDLMQNYSTPDPEECKKIFIQKI